MHLQRNKTAVISALLPAVITFLVYLPALSNGFVEWDDAAYVYANPDIQRGVDLGFLKWVLTARTVDNWHPLTIISYAIDYSIWGLDPWGYHLVNIILHAVNTFLVFVLTLKVSESLLAGPEWRKVDFYTLAAASIASLLFGLHPLHVESVATISERKDLLCAFFFLLSLLAYFKYKVSFSRQKVFYYFATLFLFIFAIMSKPMAITLPLVLLLIDFSLPGKIASGTGAAKIKGMVLEKTPFFLVSVFSAYITIWAQEKQLFPAYALPLAYRLDIVVRGYAFYLKKMLVPVALAPLYPLPSLSDFFNSGFLISLFVLIAITVFSALAARKRLYLTAWLYYLITLLPVIGFIQVGAQAAADRYAYIPSLSIFMAAGFCAAGVIARARKKTGRLAAAAVLAALAFVLAFQTVRQEAVWKDTISEWSHEIELYPGRIFPAYKQRGMAYARKGEYLKALEDFNKAAGLYQEDAVLYRFRGIVYGQMNNLGQAVEDLRKAVSLDPRDADNYYYLGLVYLKAGDLSNAVPNLKTAAGLGSGEALTRLDSLRQTGGETP